MIIIIITVARYTLDENKSLSRVQDWLNCLKNSGYRLTGPRRSVVEILADSNHALNAAQIYDLARQHYTSIGLMSVYRTLDKLEQLNLIQRVHQPGGCHAYIAAFTGHQHLLVCQECARINFFEGDRLESLFEKVAKDSGFDIKDHWLQLFGMCADCKGKKVD
jgi:Fe2+ or Zn2+ uptake regulation protein